MTRERTTRERASVLCWRVSLEAVMYFAFRHTIPPSFQKANKYRPLGQLLGFNDAQTRDQYVQVTRGVKLVAGYREALQQETVERRFGRIMEAANGRTYAGNEPVFVVSFYDANADAVFVDGVLREGAKRSRGLTHYQ